MSAPFSHGRAAALGIGQPEAVLASIRDRNAGSALPEGVDDYSLVILPGLCTLRLFWAQNETVKRVATSPGVRVCISEAFVETWCADHEVPGRGWINSLEHF
jgi:hypothetical protein